MAVTKMDIPTGPTGILQSGKGGYLQGGKKTMGGTKGITSGSAPMKPVLGKRRVGGSR